MILQRLSNRISFLLFIAIYVLPVGIVSTLLMMTNLAQTNSEFFGFVVMAVILLPLITTYGVFYSYRTTYRVAAQPVPAGAETATSEQGQGEWSQAFNKALDWKRYIIPISLLTSFVTVLTAFFIWSDIDVSPQGQIDFLGMYALPFSFGSQVQTIPIEVTPDMLPLPEQYAHLLVGDTVEIQQTVATAQVLIPSTIFYFGYLGFFLHYLEMTRRRYISRNLVPRFYLTSAFRFMYVNIAVIVVYMLLKILFGPELSPEVAFISAFVTGMFPVQLLAPVNEYVRKRLGMKVNQEISLSQIEGIDNMMESLLQEENIDSIQVLATSDIEMIHQRTAIPKATIENWQRQAKLFHVLGHEEVIQRFARTGINDFEDLQILLDIFGETPLDEAAFTQHFTSTMRIKDDEEAITYEAYWQVLIRVLLREYRAANADVQATGQEDPPVPN